MLRGEALVGRLSFARIVEFLLCLPREVAPRQSFLPGGVHTRSECESMD